VEYVALICARGGSKGLPGKNIKLLGGIPLISWSIRIAKKIDQISKIIVSTDSNEIAEIALNEGAEVPFMRPSNLSQDDSPEWLVWRHSLNYLKKIDYSLNGLLVLPPTAPLRNITDIEKCISIFEQKDSDLVITYTDSHRSPYFNMVNVDENEYSSIVIPPKNIISRRQDTPVVFDMTTVAYIVRPQYVNKTDVMWEGKVRGVHIPLERAVDIDTNLDFQFAEYLISKSNIGDL
jgi:CMP-N-acetylneuraminic acid synthetase